MEFEIFKTGTHTSDKGVTKTYTEEDLNFIASSYNPAEHEAPVVIGHPVDNSPAFGWIESVKVVGDKLIAKAKDVVQEFSDAVKKGLYKKRSISLDKDGRLRHVGFLGGAAPAVKGLADIQFNEINFADTFELENEVSESQPEPSNSPETVSSSQPMLVPQSSAFQSQLDKIETLLYSLNQNFAYDSTNNELSKINQSVEELKLTLNNKEFEDAINEKLSEGSFTPAMKEKTLNLLNYIDSQNFSADFNFSDYRNAVKHLLTDFINSVPKIVFFENFAEKPEHELSFTDNYSGLNVNPESSALHRKALSLMKKDNISYIAAVTKLSN